MLNRFAAIAFLAFFALTARADDWRMYLHDLAHSSLNSAESRIDVSNVANLTQAWTRSFGNLIAAAPTVVDGTLYFGDWSGNFYAVSAADGSILWRQYLGKSADPPFPFCMPAIGVSSQATVVGTTVYVGGGDSAVYALDIGSGQIVWRVPLADPASGSYLWSSVVAAGGALYVGVASVSDCPLVQGSLARIDLANPSKPLIRYLSPIDNPGAGVWTTPAVDTATNTVFITTGTGEPNPAAGIYGSSFVSLDATTLEIKSQFSLPGYDPDVDIEWGSSPVMFDTADGKRFAAATGKDGILYALNRDDLSLAWSVRLAVECVCPECGCGSLSTPAFDGQLLYVGAGVADPEGFDNGSVYAIDPSTGQTIWMHALSDTVIAPVTVANGLVYVSTTTGAIAYNASTGDRLWDDGGYGTLYSQPVVVNGTLFTTYFEGDVVAWTLPGPATLDRYMYSGTSMPKTPKVRSSWRPK